MTVLRVNTIAGIGSDGAGTVIGGSFNFTSQNYVILPKGTTDNRVGLGSTPGALRYNTDSSKVELYDGSQWAEVQSSRPDLNGGARGVFAGGYAPSPISGQNVIEYITISSTGNGVDFGDITTTGTGRYHNSSGSDKTRGVIAGGQTINNIEYITISSTGNAQDFGDLQNPTRNPGAVSSSTRTIFAGGQNAPTFFNIIDYITTQSTGNSVSFGTLTQARMSVVNTANSSTRGVFAGGYTPTYQNTIDYVTMSTLGNATDFGDLTTIRIYGSGIVSNPTRGLFAGGFSPVSPSTINSIEIITIATLGNSIKFGDLSQSRAGVMGCSSSTRGVFGGGTTPTYVNTIDYVSIATQGNAADFGDLYGSVKAFGTGLSNGHGGL